MAEEQRVEAPVAETEEELQVETVPSTAVELAYAGPSRVVSTETASDLELFTNLMRDPVRMHARIKEPLRFREAMSVLYAIVGSDYRYVPKDRTAYMAYLRMKKESASLGMFQAQQAYFSWMIQNDPGAFLILDPVITVHPDRLLFEVFSKDESTYAALGIDREAFEFDGEPTCGTTNIDFSQGLFDSIQQMRSYRETHLTIGKEAVKMKTAKATGGEVLEKKIRVPDSWLRGFLQVQSATTLPRDSFQMSPMDLYNVLRFLRMHGDQKGKRRGIRIELVPGESPRLVLEPWEIVMPGSAGIYKGKASRVVRVWGRRRLMLIRRMLPFFETIDVHLLGSGLPSFWVLRAGPITVTVGMTGFTAANWSSALNFDLLLPRKTQEPKAVESILAHLKGKWFAKASDIGKATGLKSAALLEALQTACQEGKIMYDLAEDVYRLRPLTETPLNLKKLEFRNDREKIAHDLLVRRSAVEIKSENRIPGTGLELVGKVAVKEDKREYRPQMLLGDEGQVLKAECTCSLFRKQGLKTGPCAHLIALRLSYAEQEARRLKTGEVRTTVTVETRTYSKRDEEGEDVYQVTLERQRVKVRWGRTGSPMRLTTLRFNTLDEARAAYFAKVDDLAARGYLDATAG